MEAKMNNETLHDRQAESDHSQPCSDLTEIKTQMVGVWASLKEFKSTFRNNLILAVTVMGILVSAFVTIFLYRDSQAVARADKIQDTALSAKSMGIVNDVRISNAEQVARETKASLRRIEDKLDNLRK